MYNCTVHYQDGVEDFIVETCTPGLPAPGTRFEFFDSDRAAIGKAELAGIVTRVVCNETDGDFTINIYTRPPRDDE